MSKKKTDAEKKAAKAKADKKKAAALEAADERRAFVMGIANEAIEMALRWELMEPLPPPSDLAEVASRVLLPGGSIADEHDSYEHRPGQVEMAEAVAASMDSRMVAVQSPSCLCGRRRNSPP